jgi:hypothetical protein
MTADTAILELERKLMELDRTIKAAEQARELVVDATLHRRNAIAARIFKTPAAGLEGLRVQARTYQLERANARRGKDDEELELDFTWLGAVLAEGVARLACGDARWRT